MSVSKSFSMFSYQLLSMQSSLSIFAQKYPRICEDTYFILQNNYLCIYENSFGAKILRDDCAHNYQLWISYHNNYLPLNPVLRDTVLATSGDGDDYGDYGDEERGDVRDVSY